MKAAANAAYLSALQEGRGGDTSDAARLAVIIEVSAGAWGIRTGETPYAFPPDAVWASARAKNLIPEHVELALRDGGLDAAASLLAGPWQEHLIGGRRLEIRMLRECPDDQGNLWREYQKRTGGTTRVQARPAGRRRAEPEPDTAYRAALNFTGNL